MPTPDKSRRSVYEIVRLPEAFGVVLLTVALILFLSPYLSGADFGIFKIPGFPDGTARALRILGPAVFLLSLFLFLPVWRASNAAVEPQALRAVPGGTRLKLTTPESVPDLVGRAMSRYGGRRWAGKPRLADLATVLAE